MGRAARSRWRPLNRASAVSHRRYPAGSLRSPVALQLRTILPDAVSSADSYGSDAAVPHLYPTDAAVSDATGVILYLSWGFFR